MTLELYELPGCSYCSKVRRKLDELDLEYVSHTVPGAHSQRDEVRELTGQTGVPVLVDIEHGIDGMAESDEIVDYLEQTYGAEATA